MRMLVIGLAVICIAAVPRERTLMDHIDDVVELMQFDDGSNVRGKAYSELRQLPDRIVDQLIEIAGTEKAVYATSAEPRVYAVHLLMQQYRSPKAVPVLVKYVDWEYTHLGATGVGMTSPIPNHPCAVALYAYGVHAALPEIYKRLEQDTPSEKAIELYAWFIVESMGMDGEEALRTVETKAKGYPDNKNFSLLLDKMKEIRRPNYVKRPKAANAEGGHLIPATEPHTLQDHLDKLLTTMQFDDGSLASERVRSAAHEELGQAHVNLMLKLVEIVGTEKESYDRHRTDSRFMAVHFLGRMHYGEAVRAFVKHVDWEYKLPDRSPVGRVVKGPISDYPCAVMLHSRGTKALLAIFGALERAPPPSDKALELYAWLVILAYEYIGGDQEAIQLVEMKASRAENNKHLLLLLEKVKEIAEQRALENG